MNLNRQAIGIALVMSSACGALQAAPLSFEYLATVTYTDGSLSGVTVGSSFNGSFSYSDAAQGSVSGNTAIYTLGPRSQLTANIGRHRITTHELNASVVDDFGGNVEDVVNIGSTQPVLWDRSLHPLASFGFNLASAPGHTDVLTSTKLPTSYDITAFDAGSSLNYGWLRRDGSSSGGVISFTVTRITSAVPDASSAATALLGLGSLGVMMRRRRKPDPTR